MKTHDPNGFPYADDHPKFFHTIAGNDPDKQILQYWFWCPGCEKLHSFMVNNLHRPNTKPWNFNKNLDAPTFKPSLGVLDHDGPQRFSCHLYLENGVIRFLNDSQHKLAGQTVPLPDMPDDPWTKNFE